MWSKKSRYLGLIISLIVILAVVGVVGWQYTHTDSYLIQKYYEDLERQYTEDTIGGTTPEETLSMFISALKIGDIDLASKYFILDQQEKWLKEIKIIRDDKLMDLMIEDLENLRLSKKEDDRVFYSLANDMNVVVVEMIIRKISLNGIWKITEL